jgi:hypothetical protein
VISVHAIILDVEELSLLWLEGLALHLAFTGVAFGGETRDGFDVLVLYRTRY